VTPLTPGGFVLLCIIAMVACIVGELLRDHERD
jgi:hypothetical protein